MHQVDPNPDLQINMYTEFHLEVKDYIRNYHHKPKTVKNSLLEAEIFWNKILSSKSSFHLLSSWIQEQPVVIKN